MNGKIGLIGGIGSAVLVAGGYGIYKKYDINNPTGIAWLEKSGHKFNPPKFTNYQNLDHGCSENLFKESNDFEDSKLYGCGIANIDVWDSGNHFSEYGKTLDILSFNSEIAIRKGNQGWKINTVVDNTVVFGLRYQHLLTEYGKESNGWTEKESFVVTPGSDESWVEKIELNKGQEHKELILIGKKKLNIKVPGGSWYGSDNYFFMRNGSLIVVNEPQDLKVKKGRNKLSKSWSGIWMHEESANTDSWIFKDIDVFIDNKKHSQVFCKGDECRKDVSNTKYQTSIYNKEERPTRVIKEEKGTWGYAGEAYYNQSASGQVTDKLTPMINVIKDLKGKWINTNDVCGLGNKRNINEAEQKKLKMFCTKQ